MSKIRDSEEFKNEKTDCQGISKINTQKPSLIIPIVVAVVTGLISFSGNYFINYKLIEAPKLDLDEKRTNLDENRNNLDEKRFKIEDRKLQFEEKRLEIEILKNDLESKKNIIESYQQIIKLSPTIDIDCINKPHSTQDWVVVCSFENRGIYSAQITINNSEFNIINDYSEKSYKSSLFHPHAKYQYIAIPNRKSELKFYITNVPGGTIRSDLLTKINFTFDTEKKSVDFIEKQFPLFSEIIANIKQNTLTYPMNLNPLINNQFSNP